MSDNQFPQLKDYIIEKRLGTGTYAAVYKARSKISNQFVAIKCIKKSSLNKSSTENLLREIQILKQIKHEFIVEFKDFQWDENYINIIMEYCQGGDLSNFIKSKRTIPEKYVRRFVQQIACALKHLHSKGIAHMDLKPQNILLTSVNNPSLKLADFGFAQFMKEESYSRSLRGSPLYMAPEILKNKFYDSKVDLWSVGVILHEVIFGYAPFISNSLNELEEKIMDDTPIQIPNHVMLSDTCKDLLRNLLQRNPADRLSFEEFFNHPFIDLNHMASSLSLPKALDLLNKAIKADEKKDYVDAQRFYLQSLEFLIPAIQFEKNDQKKQEIREKAKIYLRRAEDLANFINLNKSIEVQNKKSFASNSKLIDKEEIEKKYQYNRAKSIENAEYNNLSKTFNAASNSLKTNKNLEASSLTSFSSINLESQNSNSNISSIQTLLNLASDNKEIVKAVTICMETEEKIVTIENYEEIFNQYHTAISILLKEAKDIKNAEFSKLLKLHINKWLSKAEYIKENMQRKETAGFQEVRECMKEEEENNPYFKHCILQ